MAGPLENVGERGVGAGFFAGAVGRPVASAMTLPAYVDQFVMTTRTLAEFHYWIGAGFFGSVSDWLGDVVRTAPLSALFNGKTCYGPISGEPTSCRFSPIPQREGAEWLDPGR